MGHQRWAWLPRPTRFPPIHSSFLFSFSHPPPAFRPGRNREEEAEKKRAKGEKGTRHGNTYHRHLRSLGKHCFQPRIPNSNDCDKRLATQIRTLCHAAHGRVPNSFRFWFGGQRLAIRFHPFPFSFENRNGRKQKQAKKKPDQTKETKKGKHGAEARQRGTAKAQQRTEAEPWPGVLQHKWMQTHPAKAHKKAGPIRFFPSPGACDGTQPVRTQPHTPEGENTIFRFHSTHTHTHTTCTTPRIEYRQRKNEGNTQQHNITTRNKTRPQPPTIRTKKGKPRSGQRRGR